MKRENVLNKVVNEYGKVVGKKQETLSELHECRVVRKARMIVYDSSRVLFQYYNTLPSGRRFRVPKTESQIKTKLYISMSITLLSRQILPTCVCCVFACVDICVDMRRCVFFVCLCVGMCRWV